MVLRARTTHTLLAVATVALVGAACGGSDLAEQAQELADAAGQAVEDAEEANEEALAEEDADVGDEDTAERAEPPATVDLDGLEAQVPAGTVYQRGFEFTLTELQVLDLDQQHADETGTELTDRVRGFEVVAEVDVFNATPDPGQPGRTAVSLRWEEPGSDNVVDVRGQLEVREIPSQASSSGQVTVPLSVDDAELLDVETAAFVFGETGRSAAVLPIGSQPELVTRLPEFQSALEGETIDLDGIEVTIVEGWVYYGTASDGPLPDGEALLELTYDVDNAIDAQSCSTRGTGAWALTLPDGTGVVDLGVSERCVSGDQVERGILTGFFIDADYPGEYTLAHERGAGGETLAGEISFTLLDEDGSTHAERS
jgi:hypothetical protein